MTVHIGGHMVNNPLTSHPRAKRRRHSGNWLYQHAQNDLQPQEETILLGKLTQAAHQMNLHHHDHLLWPQSYVDHLHWPSDWRQVHPDCWEWLPSLITTTEHPYLKGGLYWIKPDDCSQACIPIRNGTPFSVKLLWNEVIGTLENLDGIQCKEIQLEI